MESKSRSKTIDLCNNPQHKESKLDMAKRIISGPLFNESWIELDMMVKDIEEKENKEVENANVKAKGEVEIEIERQDTKILF